MHPLADQDKKSTQNLADFHFTDTSQKPRCYCSCNLSDFWYDAIHIQCREFTDFYCPTCQGSISVAEIPADIDQISFDCWDVGSVSATRFDPNDEQNFCHPTEGICMTSTYAYHLSNQNQGVVGIIRGCANDKTLTETDRQNQLLKPPFHIVDTSLVLDSRGSDDGDISRQG